MGKINGLLLCVLHLQNKIKRAGEVAPKHEDLSSDLQSTHLKKLGLAAVPASPALEKWKWAVVSNLQAKQ